MWNIDGSDREIVRRSGGGLACTEPQERNALVGSTVGGC